MSPVQFFLVWRDGGDSPTYQHKTFEATEREAERLAKAVPGQNFYVLAPILRFRRTDMEREAFQPVDQMLTDDQIPF